MIVESRMLKIKLCFYWKRKKKRIDVPVTRSYFYLFLSHMHAVLSRGAQWNHRKMSECSIFPNLSIHYHLCLVGYIHPGRISPLGSRTASRSDISDLISDISDVSNLSEPGSGSSTVIIRPGRTYLTSRICLVPVGFQNYGRLSKSNTSDPKSDIFNPPDLFGLHPVPKALHPSMSEYNQAASDISDPTKFELVLISHRTYPI
jgi:hypothetical protein